jgi:predicted RNA-binding protein Jag
LYEVGDPNAEDHEFVDLCDTMEEHLLTEGKDLSYQDLVAFARKIVHSSEQSE